QVKDLQLPTLLVVNMSDRMALKGISIDVENLKKSLHTDIILISSRNNSGITELKKAIENHHNQSRQPFYTEDKQAYRSWVLDTFSIGYLSIDDKQRERDVKKDQHQQTVK